jgi:lysophospholipase L1-like esterase
VRIRHLRIAVAVALIAGLAGCAAPGTPAPGATTGAPPATPRPNPPLPAVPLIAFYGDSYTLGTGASSPAKRWSTIVCGERGWREDNPSVNGLGFVNNRAEDGVDLPAAIIAKRPDIVMVTMGLNDNFSYASASSEIHRRIDADISRLATALPDARLIVVEPFWYTDDRPASLGVIAGWVHDAAIRAGADWIPGASHWIEHHPEWMAADDLHPNDAGYAHMAVEMDAALAQLGLPGKNP